MGTLHSVRCLDTTHLFACHLNWNREREWRGCLQGKIARQLEWTSLKCYLRHTHFSTFCRHANFGDIGMACKELVDEFQKHTTNTKRMNTIEDMQNFVENFSEFSAAQRNAGKHVTLVSELSRVVDARSLMRVGLGSFTLMMGQATMLSVSSHHP